MLSKRTPRASTTTPTRTTTRTSRAASASSAAARRARPRSPPRAARASRSRRAWGSRRCAHRARRRARARGESGAEDRVHPMVGRARRRRRRGRARRRAAAARLGGVRRAPRGLLRSRARLAILDPPADPSAAFGPDLVALAAAAARDAPRDARVARTPRRGAPVARGSVPGLGQRERRRAVRRALAPPARRSRRTCYPLLLPLARSSCPLVCVVASFLLSCIAPRGHVGGTCRSTITHTLMRALSASRFRACAHAHEQRIRSDIAASLMCAEHAFCFLLPAAGK